MNTQQKPAQKKSNRLLDSIGNKMLALVGAAFLVGTVGVTVFFTQDQERAILEQHERSLDILTHTVGSGLQTIMQSGSADIAESYIEDIKNVKKIKEIDIFRIDGKEAFKDNQTIRQVNARMGTDHFSERDETSGTTLSGQEMAILQTALEKGRSQPHLSTQEQTDESLLTIYYPIHNGESCTGCHGQEKPFRGVLKITTALQEARAEVIAMQRRVITAQFLAMILVLAAVFFKIRRYVVTPVERLSASMLAVTSGNLYQKADEEGCLEFRTMAGCFNQMSRELAKTHSGLQNERDKLTTIILGAKEGIVVTDRTEEIVLVNPAAERLLGKDEETLRKQGFRNIVDDPEYFSAVLHQDIQSVPDIIVFNGRMLQIQATTIYSNDQVMVGSAALIRDVTQEKELEKELRHLSNTDALTGLYNRRRFDAVMEEEYRRAERYRLVLGLLLFDVDHFKKFNDTYGHDQGDRVLTAIGKVMNNHFRQIDHPCRYGGEEFCAVLPSTGLEGVETVAERLREKIEAMEIDGLKVTISIGVSVFPNSGPTSPEHMLKMADEALYEAKQKGRNRVCFAPSKKD